MSVVKNLVGKRVYRNSSYAPNRGTVDPKGYLVRELKKRGVSKIGGDGMSDTRAGLAKAALMRMHGRPMHSNSNSPKSKFAQMRLGQPLGGPRRPMIPGANDAKSQFMASFGGHTFGGPDDGRPIAPQNGGANPIPRDTILYPPGFDGDKGAQQAPAQPAQPAQPIPRDTIINPNGIPTKGTPGTVSINSNGRLDLPFSMQHSQAALQKQQQANEALFQLQQEGQEQARAYLNNLRGAQQGYDKVRYDTLNDNAGRGVAFSSGYGHAVAQNATNYNNQVNELNSGNTEFQNRLVAERTQVENNFRDFLRQQALQRAYEAQAKAGKSGIGGPGKKPKPKKPKKRK